MNDCATIPPDLHKQLYNFAKENELPLCVTLELTPFCNFNCVMCYVKQTPNEAEKYGSLIRKDEWLDVARQAQEMGTLYLTLTGGEPFTHPEFWSIYSELNKMGFLITVLSNGSLIDEEVIEKFKEYGQPYSMKLTLYGAGDETYLKTCDSKDGFTRITKAIELLKEANIPLYLTTTIVRENAGDLQKMYRFARKAQIPFQHTLTVVRSSRGAVNNVESSRFSLDEFDEELSLEDLEKNKFPPLKTPYAWCSTFGASLWMTWNGKLQTCSFVTKPSVSWSGCLENDWKKLIELSKKIKNPPECDGCKWSEFCQRCPGLLCAESKDPEKIDRGLCRTAEKLYDLYQKKLAKEEKI